MRKPQSAIEHFRIPGATSRRGPFLRSSICSPMGSSRCNKQPVLLFFIQQILTVFIDSILQKMYISFPSFSKYFMTTESFLIL